MVHLGTCQGLSRRVLSRLLRFRVGNVLRMETSGTATPDEALAEIGRVIRGLRNEARMSQRGLADAAGLALSTVKRIEDGNHDYKTSSWFAIANALGVSIEVILRRAGIIG